MLHGNCVDGSRSDDANINFVFFFQAEDGIRDSPVTGVQTCALPISEVLALARRGVFIFRFLSETLYDFALGNAFKPPISRT